MSTTDTTVWFLLVDKDGNPFRGTRVTSVSLSPNSNIVQFKDEVKEKYNVPGFLRDVPSACLSVYKDKSDFDSKVSQLNSSHTLHNLGKTTTIPLIVVAPGLAPVESVYSIIDEFLSSMTVNLDNIWKDSSCLTFDLGNRVSGVTLDQNENIKVMLAVSGGGKTRTLLELLYKKFGMYFVTSKMSSLIGSLDLYYCADISLFKQENVKNYIGLLLYLRLRIMRWFIDNGKTPDEWLYAQLYPVEVFGCDFFLDCYKHLVMLNHQIRATYIPNCLIAVDEVQEFFDEKVAFWEEFNNVRPFISPLVLYMKEWTKYLVISGTEINYSALRMGLSSNTLKSTPYDIVNINGFPFLDEEKIYQYSCEVIEKRLQISGKTPLRTHTVIAKTISQNILCHGRPRIPAFVIDTFFEKLNYTSPVESLNLAFLKLESFACGHSSKGLIRFFVEEEDPCKKLICGKSFSEVITGMFVNSLINGKGEFILPKNEQNLTAAAEMVSRGIHMELRDTDCYIHMTLKEPAAREYLSACLNFQSYVYSLLEKIGNPTQNLMVGDWFEYLVADALIRKYGVKDKSMKKSMLYLDEYLSRTDETNTYFKPNDQCGPDIILKTGKTVWIVQVRCVKRYYRDFRLKSAETVDPNLFYTVRKKDSKNYGKPLKGYEQYREMIINALNNHEIRKIVVASTQVKIPTNKHPEITWINQNLETGKDFFLPINGDQMAVWKILEEQCKAQADFEIPNCEDPYNFDES